MKFSSAFAYICWTALVVSCLISCRATPTPTPEPGTVRLDPKDIEQVWVPAGSFMMGTGNPEELDPPSRAEKELESEQPQHEVFLTAGYWIDKDAHIGFRIVTPAEDGD